MRPIYALAVAFTLSLGFVACGPSDAEMKADSAKKDSIAKSMNNEADSTIAAMNAMNEASKRAEDSTAKADSIKKADSIANAGKGKKK